jgi:hypothetical protein
MYGDIDIPPDRADSATFARWRVLFGDSPSRLPSRASTLFLAAGQYRSQVSRKSDSRRVSPSLVLFPIPLFYRDRVPRPLALRPLAGYPLAVASIFIGPEEVDLDCVLEETYSYGAEVVRHPVQRGVDVVDHLRPDPLGLDLRVLITDTPTRAPTFGLDGAQPVPGSVLSFDGAFSRVRSVPARLRLAQTRGEVVSYLGRDGLVENLLMGAFSVPFTSRRAVEISLRLEQLLVAEAQLVPIPEAAQPRGNRRRDKGKQPSAEAPPEERASFLANLVGL